MDTFVKHSDTAETWDVYLRFARLLVPVAEVATRTQALAIAESIDGISAVSSVSPVQCRQCALPEVDGENRRTHAGR